MMRLLEGILLTGTSVVLLRWGFGMATPRGDWRKLWRLRVWGQQAGRFLSGLPTRLKVIASDLIGLDQLRWRLLRRRFTSGYYASDAESGS